MPRRVHKKNLIVSYNNLSDQLKELFKELYPDGHSNHLQRTVKPNGEPIFVVPMETEDTVYMVKFEVRIDTGLVEEDLDKDLYGDDKGDDGEDFAPISEAMDKEEGGSRAVGSLKHGDYEDIFNDNAAKKEFAMAAADIAAELGKDDDDDFDSYTDDEEEEDDDEMYDDEPKDDDLLDLEGDFLDDVLNDNPLEETPKRGRKKSTAEKPAKGKATAKATKSTATKATKTATKATKAAPKTKKTTSKK